MLVASKIVWAGIVFTFLTTGILGPRPTSFVSRSSLSKEEPAVAHDSDVKQVQQSLRDKGHYRGKVDGIIGLRTRASIRAYQKAENLPVTGGIDSQTAGKLGVGPESSGGSFKRAGHRVGEGIDNTGHEIGQGKPSAGIKWAKGRGRASKQLRKEASGAADPETDRGDYHQQEAENEKQKY
jgi:peptidoglycan hydrolase-like protein with peptidoglycan-binding domain